MSRGPPASAIAVVGVRGGPNDGKRFRVTLTRVDGWRVDESIELRG